MNKSKINGEIITTAPRQFIFISREKRKERASKTHNSYADQETSHIQESLLSSFF